MHLWNFDQGGLFGQVKYAVIKIFFSKGGVTLQYAPMKFWWGALFGQVKYAVIKISFKEV